MNKSGTNRPGANSRGRSATPGDKKDAKKQTKRPRKMSEYGRQLFEKQKVKRMYGLRERQFKRFFV